MASWLQQYAERALLLRAAVLCACDGLSITACTMMAEGVVSSQDNSMIRFGLVFLSYGASRVALQPVSRSSEYNVFSGLACGLAYTLGGWMLIFAMTFVHSHTAKLVMIAAVFTLASSGFGVLLGVLEKNPNGKVVWPSRILFRGWIRIAFLVGTMKLVDHFLPFESRVVARFPLIN